MSTEEILTKILEALSQPQPAPAQQPISIALWDKNDIAAYLHRSQDPVYSNIVCLPPFPKPIRLPVKGRAQTLYKARDVIAWKEQHQSL